MFDSKLRFDKLDPALIALIEEDRRNGTLPQFAFSDAAAVRRNDMERDRATLWRPTFVRDCEKIMHSDYFDRYADKTQVFSFSKNDDITRRAQHVQLVSRIARNIGKVLNLNLDLIEAIALGHDIGHTPFGHAGERMLDQLFGEFAGKSFQHNVHSVRVLDSLIPYNLTLQTLNGILSHNGELELAEYRPVPMRSFDELDDAMSSCYEDKQNNLKMIPSTLEGCVVRICDIIAYLGKDRQDAMIVGLITADTPFPECLIGKTNAEIINNLTVNIIKNSYGKPYIKLDPEYFEALSSAKKANYELIYQRDDHVYDDTIRPMMRQIYERLRRDLTEGNTASMIYAHHIDYINEKFYRTEPYEDTPVDQIVVDYIASMTDDYFLELYNYLFPKSRLKVEYKGYF